MTRDVRWCRGTTLVELLVVLCILGVIAGVTVLAIRRFDSGSPDDPASILAESLRAAVDTPRTIVVSVAHDGQPLSATIRPDGSIVADSALDADRLTGRTVHAR
jgi:prepilin-type N-terminal cleavage/methylation domain-containing protein